MTDIKIDEWIATHAPAKELAELTMDTNSPEQVEERSRMGMPKKNQIKKEVFADLFPVCR